MLERKYLPILFTVSLVGSFLAHYYIRNNEPLRGSLSAILDAIFIAAFLAYAVDPVLKQGLLREGIRSIFRYIYGYSLPPALQKFYDTTVVGTKDLRTDCQLNWRISPIPNSSDRVSVRLHVTFRMVNFTNEPLHYRHEVFALSDVPGAKGSVEALFCVDTKSQTNEYQLDKDALNNPAKDRSQPRKKFTDVRPEYKAGPAITLEPKDADEGGRYKFGVHYSSESSWPNGLDWFLVAEVTTDIEVCITVDDALKDHLFSVIPSPPDNSSDRQKPNYDYETQNYRCRWKYPRLFVPNEVVIVRWHHPELLTSPDSAAPEAFSVGGSPADSAL